MRDEQRDFPVGHPKSFDYNPDSPAAQEWARKHVHPKGQRDWPVDHPKAMDTPGNLNKLVWSPGVDPRFSKPAPPKTSPVFDHAPQSVRAQRVLDSANSK